MAGRPEGPCAGKKVGSALETVSPRSGVDMKGRKGGWLFTESNTVMTS